MVYNQAGSLPIWHSTPTSSLKHADTGHLATTQSKCRFLTFLPHIPPKSLANSDSWLVSAYANQMNRYLHQKTPNTAIIPQIQPKLSRILNLCMRNTSGYSWLLCAPTKKLARWHIHLRVCTDISRCRQLKLKLKSATSCIERPGLPEFKRCKRISPKHEAFKALPFVIWLLSTLRLHFASVRMATTVVYHIPSLSKRKRSIRHDSSFWMRLPHLSPMKLLVKTSNRMMHLLLFWKDVSLPRGSLNRPLA